MEVINLNQRDSNEIIETINDLKKARENSQRIDELFSNDPDLHEIYIYSANELIKKLENHLEYLLNKQTESAFTLTSQSGDADIWIHIEGEKYGEGRGPINSIGSYLKKLNTAAQHTINVLKERSGSLKDLKFDTYFELVGTAKGSLKLGLKSKVKTVPENDNQGSIFDEDPETKLTELKVYSQIQKLSSTGLSLLLKALSSTDDEQAIGELLDKYGEEDTAKLLYFAKELAPSSRSNIRQVLFEGRLLPENKSEIKLNRDTRKQLMLKSKILKNKEFIEGTALIEQYTNNVNSNYYSLFAKPLKYNGTPLNIELRFDKRNHDISEEEVLNEFINVEGFLHFNNRSNPNYVAVERIVVDVYDD
jgi:hypothetical protein